MFLVSWRGATSRIKFRRKGIRGKKERKIFKIKKDLWNYFLKIGLLILHLFLFTYDRCLSGSTCLSRTLDYRCHHDLFRRCGTFLILVYRCCKYIFFRLHGKRIIINNRFFMYKKICKKDVRIFEDILILSFFIIHIFIHIFLSWKKQSSWLFNELRKVHTIIWFSWNEWIWKIFRYFFFFFRSYFHIYHRFSWERTIWFLVRVRKACMCDNCEIAFVCENIHLKRMILRCFFCEIREMGDISRRYDWKWKLKM